MKLSHFTSTNHLPRILASRALKVTDGEGGPPVVWLTDSFERAEQLWGRPFEDEVTLEMVESGQLGRFQIPPALLPKLRQEGRLTLIFIDKTAIRFTVEVPDEDAYPWPSWARAHRIGRAYYEALASTGGDPERWWVVPRPIPDSEWLEIIDLSTGKSIAPNRPT